MAKSKPLAKKSEAEVVLSTDCFPLKLLGRWMACNRVPELTEEQAVKLLADKEFMEILLDDVFDFASECLEEDTDASFDGMEKYADVLNRLEVPHDGSHRGRRRPRSLRLN